MDSMNDVCKRLDAIISLLNRMVYPTNNGPLVFNGKCLDEYTDEERQELIDKMSGCV